jgi:DNA-binding PucR family transcriptional regulator
VISTLGGLLEYLEIIQVLVAPAGLDADVNGLVVHDPIDDVRIEPGDLVLGVGVDVERHEAIELVHTAGLNKAVAVAVKVRGESIPGALITEARTAGVALLGVATEVAWGQLYTLLRTAATGIELDGGSGPGGIAVGDLFALANAVAAMVGGAVTIETPQSVVLAYSSLDEPIDQGRRDTILGRKVPDAWLRRLEQDGVFHRLWASDDVIRISYTEPSDFRTRLAIAVRAGGQILGSIWVAEGRTHFGKDAEAALREAGRIAALHLVRHQVGDDLERRRNSDLFRSVLEGRRPPELLAEPLNLPAQSAATVIGFQLHATEPADLAVHVDRVVSLIELYGQAYRHKVVCAGIGNVIYVLLTDATEPDPARLRRLATAIVEQSRDSLGIVVHAGIGATVSLNQLLTSRQDANLVLRALTERGADATVAATADVHAQTVLLRLRDLVAAEPRLLTGKLDVLADLDARKSHTHYLATLRAYLDALGDVPTAAAALSVHPNTYRYRLRRLLDLAGIDITDPTERLVLHLQLHLLSHGQDVPTESTQLGPQDDE